MLARPQPLNSPNSEAIGVLVIYPLEAASRFGRGPGGENQKIENRRAFSITGGEDGVLSFSLV